MVLIIRQCLTANDDRFIMYFEVYLSYTNNNCNPFLSKRKKDIKNCVIIFQNIENIEM